LVTVVVIALPETPMVGVNAEIAKEFVIDAETCPEIGSGDAEEIEATPLIPTGD
jgi:hypothetical protein